MFKMDSKISAGQKIQQVSTKGILCRNGKILVLKTTRSGRWELPGGRINFGESAAAAFKREIKEELGLRNVKPGKFINIWSFTSLRNGTNYHFIILDFEIFTNENKIKLSKEHTECKWIKASDLKWINMRQGHKESLRKYFKTAR